jgi:hypothetical protein
LGDDLFHLDLLRGESTFSFGLVILVFSVTPIRVVKSKFGFLVVGGLRFDLNLEELNQKNSIRVIVHMVHQEVEHTTLTLDQEVLEGHLFVFVEETLKNFVEVTAQDRQKLLATAQKVVNKLVKERVVYLFLGLLFSDNGVSLDL